MYSREEIITKSRISEYKEFLKKHELTYEETDYTIGLYDGDRLIGCCSLTGNCIKLLAIDDLYQGQGLTNTLVGEMIKRIYMSGRMNAFIFTKPEKEFEFNKLGFYTIVKTEDVLFLEKRSDGIGSYLKKLEEDKVERDRVASIVMNLNPFTLGHRSLIEKASRENDHVHIFIVREDKSIFPYDVRLELLRRGTEEFENVTVHEGSEYIVSSTTFPTYFIKSKDEIPEIYARVDALVFARYIAKALNISKRYVGTEPLSKTTNMYNKVLKEALGEEGIEVIEVARSQAEGRVVSASYVRRYIREGRLEEAFKLLPETTIEFLRSDRGKEIIKKIEKMSVSQRH